MSIFGATKGTKPPSNKSLFVKELAKLTGLKRSVVEAWVNHEQPDSTVGGGNNWLNVETGGPGGGAGPSSGTADYVEGLSPQRAAAYTAAWLRRNQPTIIDARSKSAGEQVEAIEQSGFAETHYYHQSPELFLSAA